MMRVMLAAFALAGCAQTTSSDTLAQDTPGPLDGFWEIATTQTPDSGCTFSGAALMERVGTSVQYRAVIHSTYACPDGRSFSAMQACEGYDLAVLQVTCSADPAQSTAGYAGDAFSIQRPDMQAAVDTLEGSIRLPESDYERLRGADYIAPHLVRWTRRSSTESGQ
jgi:hypothetical protein